MNKDEKTKVFWMIALNIIVFIGINIGFYFLEFSKSYMLGVYTGIFVGWIAASIYMYRSIKTKYFDERFIQLSYKAGSSAFFISFFAVWVLAFLSRSTSIEWTVELKDVFILESSLMLTLYFFILMILTRKG